MLSQLGPLFKATFRHAEESDSRQNLPHEVNKDGRRKNDGETDNHVELWEDSTGVSVVALRAFLINFLSGTTKQTGLAHQPDAADSAAAPSRPAANTATARAAGAYQSTADKLEPHHTTPPAVPSAAPRTDADLVAGADIRLMHGLIADLETLEQAGVEMLTLNPAESFLQSLKNAVDTALGR